jgi:hypothetical protein
MLGCDKLVETNKTALARAVAWAQWLRPPDDIEIVKP